MYILVQKIIVNISFFKNIIIIDYNNIQKCISFFSKMGWFFNQLGYVVYIYYIDKIFGLVIVGQ